MILGRGHLFTFLESAMWYVVTRSGNSAWEASTVRASYMLAKTLARSAVLKGCEAFVRAETYMGSGTDEHGPNRFESLSYGA